MRKCIGLLARRRRLAAHAVAASAAAIALAVPADAFAAEPPAAAGSTACSSASINPKRVISNYTERRSIPLDGRKISLMAGNWPGSADLYGWAEIAGPTKGSDRVWMDVSNDWGKTWTQCGPFSVDVDGTLGFTRAEPASSSKSRKFRACGDIMVAGKRKLACTTWW
jgi:hypothetical protein